MYREKDYTHWFVFALLGLIAVALVYAFVGFFREGEQCKDRGGVYVRNATTLEYKCVKGDPP